MEMEARSTGASVATQAVLAPLLARGPQAFIRVYKGTDQGAAQVYKDHQDPGGVLSSFSEHLFDSAS